MVVSPRCLERGSSLRLRHTIHVRDDRPTRWMQGAMARSNDSLHMIHSPILCYGLSIVCVAIALGVSLALQYYQFRDVEVAVLTVAGGLVTWYGGIGRGALAVVLGTM